MPRCLSMVNTVVMSIVCACVVGGCAAQGDADDDPPDSKPAMQDLANPTLLTYFQSFTTDQFGNIFLTGIIDVSANKEADLEIIQFPGNVPNMNVSVSMGKISGHTLGASVGSFAFNTAGTIHTFNVIGPEVTVVITGGPPNTAVNVQAWLFLH
jgi:hypothetical protein